MIFLAACLARIQYLLTKSNMAARYNGFGAIPSVQDKTADAPMAYRVLVPWLIGKPTMQKYQAFQFVLILTALYSVYLAWGASVLLVSCIILTVTFRFDYWDGWGELIGFSLALTSLPLAIIGAVIHGLSRETAFLVGVVYALHSRDWTGGLLVTLIGIAALLVVRKVQGVHPLYCKRWMIKDNIERLKKRDIYTLCSVVLCMLAGAGAWGRLDGLIIPILAGAGWTMARSDETRVFTGLIPYASILLVRSLT